MPTVKLPVIGSVDQKWVYAGGALTAGIVGYAWWTRGTTNGDITVDEEAGLAFDAFGNPLQPGSSPDYVPPTGFGGFTAVDDTGVSIRTNAEWTQAAVEYLTSVGYSPVAVSSALGKFLQRQELNAVDLDMARAALAAIGPPPEGGPWPLRSETAETAPPAQTAPPEPLNPPTYVDATNIANRRWRLAWGAVAGADGYNVRRVRGGVPGTIGFTRETMFITGQVPEQGSLSFQVRTVRDGKRSAWRTQKTR